MYTHCLYLSFETIGERNILAIIMVPLVPVDRQSPARRKIRLFRSLFRGREDVYPRRFESRKTGKAGYTPACANEWVRDVCDKRSVKCASCPHRKFLPVTDDAIAAHLRGRDESGKRFVMGVYPMLEDETCRFLAVDFDKSHWRKDAALFLETCERLGIPAVLERSRSGNGGHVWFFFAGAVPAVLARGMASCILTETMEQHPDIGLDSYDRFFPNQDTLPKGGFGNLIALPLQHEPRSRGNSVFVDTENFEPFADQWARLSAVRRISPALVAEIARRAEKTGRIIGAHMAVPEEDDDGAPWLLPPSRGRKTGTIEGTLPKEIALTLADQVYIPTEGLSPPLKNRLIRLAAFPNPAFHRAQSLRLPTYDKPRIIACAEDFPRHTGLPRGCLEDLLRLLDDLNIKYTITDRRNTGRELNMAFTGRLRPEQQAAAESMCAHDTGVLAATTAFGKTVLAAWLIARRGVNTLVLVHRRQLLEQWVNQLSAFLDLDPGDIGRFAGNRKKPTGMIDVAMLQSLVRKGTVNDLVAEYGHLVVDECHHLSAFSFEQVARRATARFVTGLSATVTRKDGHHPIIFMQCGPVRYRTDARRQAGKRPFAHTVHVRPTGFLPPSPADSSDTRLHYQQLCSELLADDARNRRICRDIIAAVREGRTPVVLTERREHLDILEQLLSPDVVTLVVLRGGMGKKATSAAMKRLADDSGPRVLLATGRYIGEGFDDPRLDTLFLTMPISWRGTIAQYAGRLHRRHRDKREVRIYDYADLDVPMLARMFDRRCRGYESMGYTVLLPAGATPSWPVDVPLPVDPRWKQDYAASVRRLVRDGVDTALAGLFLEATRPHPYGANGVSRARSAGEAFLFRRLETMEKTRGLFLLNATLPIPFNRHSSMEVDFLAADYNLVVELDGDQHLVDPAAYRRDRRKDALLQENGYFVLRFLAGDLAGDLDHVLDTITRTLRRLDTRREGE